MTEASKKVKVSCIVAFIVGLLGIVASIVCVVASPINARSWVLLVDCIACTYMGFQGARKINIPSNALEVRNLCAVIVLVTFICAAFILVAHGKSILETIFASADLILSIVCYTAARKAMIIEEAK